MEECGNTVIGAFFSSNGIIEKFSAKEIIEFSVGDYVPCYERVAKFNSSLST